MRLTNFSMETGNGSTDATGVGTVTLSGQYFYAPIVTVIGQGDAAPRAFSPDDAFGNTNVIIKSVSKSTGQWIVTVWTEPHVTFNYQAMGQILERV